jgi:hypothetical protein
VISTYFLQKLKCLKTVNVILHSCHGLSGMMPCCDVEGYQCFRDPCCLHLCIITQCHNPKDHNMNLHGCKNLKAHFHSSCNHIILKRVSKSTNEYKNSVPTT